MEQNPFEIKNNKKKNPFETGPSPKRKTNTSQIIMLIAIILLIFAIIFTINQIINTIAFQQSIADSRTDDTDQILDEVQEAEMSYLDSVSDSDWTWSEDFIDSEYPNTKLTDAILFDDFTGEDTQLEFKANGDREEQLDLSDIEPGIYTIYNTSDSGYLHFYLSEYRVELVLSDEAIYNIPITAQTTITINSADSDEDVKIEFEAQSNYVQHDSEHNQGLFITGKSLEDNVIYDKEFAVGCYPTVNGENLNDYSCIYNPENMRGDIPGSFIFSHTY